MVEVTDEALGSTVAEPPAPASGGLLSPEQQDRILEWLTKGAGPVAACQQLGLSVDQFWETLSHDARFAGALQRLFDTLSQNVLAALYQSAMKGRISAQQFWLRQRPAVAWTTASEHNDDLDPLLRLNDDELVDECRAAGVDLPPEVAARMAAEAGEA